MFKTIRSRLMLWNFIITFVILGWFSVALYFNLANSMQVQRDVELRRAAEWVVDQLLFREGAVEFVDNGIFSTDEMVILVQDVAGTTLVERNGPLNSSSEDVREVQRFIIDNPIWGMRQADGTLYHMVTIQDELDEEEGVVGEPLAVQAMVGLSQEGVQSELNFLRWYLFGLSMVLFLFANGIAYLLMGRLLRPLQQMAHSAELISEKNLDQRLPLANPKDEIGQLGAAFNRLFERLHHAFESQRRFVADASHELRTPLATLQAKLEVALQQRRSEEEYTKVISTSLNQTQRLSDLVKRLLMLARADAGRLEFEKKPVQLASVIDSVKQQAHSLLHQKKLQFDVQIKEKFTVLGDEELLCHAFFNLLENAIKYTESGGSIQLSVDQAEQQVLIQLCDTGVGIPEKELPQVFDRFYRVDKVRTISASGTGLGLSIVAEIVALHGGNIAIHSKLNEGTQVEVLLPLA